MDELILCPTSSIGTSKTTLSIKSEDGYAGINVSPTFSHNNGFTIWLNFSEISEVITWLEDYQQQIIDDEEQGVK